MRPIPSLQALRGIAALLVVVSHIPGELLDRGLTNPLPAVPFGVFGVDLFFVLSGFVMIYATAPAFGASANIPAFILRRLARLVPLYWLVTTLFICIIITTGGNPSYTAPYVISSYLFVPYPQPEDGDAFPVFSLGWTLNFEMFFYACLACVLVLKRTLAVATLSASFSILIVTGLLISLPLPFNVWASSQILEFVFGMGLAELHLRGVRLPRRLCWVLVGIASLAVLVSANSIQWWLPVRGFVWGPPAVMIVAALLSRSGGTGSVKSAFQWLGDASYSLYLSHILVFAGLAYALRHALRHPERVSSLGYAGLLLIASVVAAFGVFRFFEKPVTRALQRAFA